MSVASPVRVIATSRPSEAVCDDRIEFASGEDRAQVQGSVRDRASHRYVLWAAAGQQMTIDLDSVEEHADVAVSDPSGAAIVEGADGHELRVWVE